MEQPQHPVLAVGDAEPLLDDPAQILGATFLASHAALVDEAGRRLVRDGFLPERTIQTRISEVPVVRQPWVLGRRPMPSSGSPPRSCRNPAQQSCYAALA